MSSPTESPDEHADEELVRAYLAAHDANCPGCGYNLRGSPGRQCPECGERISLAIASGAPPGGGLRAGYFGLAFAILLAVLLAIEHLRYRPWVSVVAAFGAVWLGGALSRWHAGRDRFERLARHKKQERVAVAWIPAVLLIILLMMP